MSAPLLPADGSYVEMTSFGETMPEVRVVQASGTAITLSLAAADLPPANSTVTLRWAAAPRGRYALVAHVSAIDGNRVEVRFSGEPAIEQSRDYVRGGGGEPIVLLLDGQETAPGQVHDLSEHSVRARFTDVTVRPGDAVTLRIQLDDEVVEFPAEATKVSSLRQQVPARGPLHVEMVAVFPEIDEHQAKILRRYILQAQLRARRQY
ncbi:PilZ domain-containing protein [Actinoplanes sp. NPDC000266]